MLRHRLWLVGGMVGGVGIAVLAFGGTPTETPTHARKQPLQWGIYQILWSRAFKSQLAAQTSRFASQPHYVMFYRDLGRPFPTFPIDVIDEQGATAVVSLELWSWHGGRQGGYLPLINAGKYRRVFRKWAQDAKADGRRILLRFGFEFNGNWFTWSGDPQAYVAAWRRAHDIFREVGADNVEWVWAPNVVSCPDTPANNMHLYYPGDDYVDWIGVDGYNFGDHHDEWHQWQSFEEIFSTVLTDFAVRYAHKPVIISEVGCAPGGPGRQAEWIREAYGTLARFEQVKAVVWFNYNKRGENEPDFRLDREADTLQAFNTTFARPVAPPSSTP